MISGVLERKGEMVFAPWEQARLESESPLSPMR